MSTPSVGSRTPLPALAPLIGAFAAVYIIWGSTYLGIKYAIETLPPLSMAGVRFAIAGALVVGWMRLCGGAHRASARQWWNATLVGGLLLLAGNGLICIAQQRLPSGLTALLVATVPLWMTLLDWLVFRGARPSRRVAIGLAIGLLGVLVLIDPKNLLGESIHLPSAIMVLVACTCWSLGSLASRRLDMPPSLMLSSGMQMLTAGMLLMAAAAIRGDWASFDVEAITARSALAFGYLVIFGSLVGFSAYVWLLKHVSPSAVSTYAYVNPMVAVLLGWAFAHEPITPTTVGASILIITAVVMITLRRVRRDSSLTLQTTPSERPLPALVGASERKQLGITTGAASSRRELCGTATSR